MKCPRCQQDNPVEDAQFCPRCGAPVKRVEDSGPAEPSYADLQRALTEALEQQAATIEICESSRASPTDIQPVFEAVAELVARLCDSPDVSIFRIEGDVMHLAVHRGPIGSLPPYGDERVSLERSRVVGRSVIERRTIHISDLSSETQQYPEGSARARRFRNRTVLSVPFLRKDVAIGAIAVRRTEARLFTKRQVALLQTFADPAVIAIENVRLFRTAPQSDLTVLRCRILGREHIRC